MKIGIAIALVASVVHCAEPSAESFRSVAIAGEAHPSATVMVHEQRQGPSRSKPDNGAPEHVAKPGHNSGDALLHSSLLSSLQEDARLPLQLGQKDMERPPAAGVPVDVHILQQRLRKTGGKLEAYDKNAARPQQLQSNGNRPMEAPRPSEIEPRPEQIAIQPTRRSENVPHGAAVQASLQPSILIPLAPLPSGKPKKKKCCLGCLPRCCSNEERTTPGDSEPFPLPHSIVQSPSGEVSIAIQDDASNASSVTSVPSIHEDSVLLGRESVSSNNPKSKAASDSPQSSSSQLSIVYAPRASKGNLGSNLPAARVPAVRSISHSDASSAEKPRKMSRAERAAAKVAEKQRKKEEAAAKRYRRNHAQAVAPRLQNML